MRKDKDYGLVSCNYEAKLLAKIDRDIAKERKSKTWKVGDLMKVHRCNERLCRRIIPLNQRYCSEHAKLHQFKPIDSNEKRRLNFDYNHSKRNQKANSFYHSKQWQKVRDYVFSRDMATCQVCGNVITNRKIVDHIIPRRLCADPLSSTNLWVLCYKCHSNKTRLEEHMKDNQLKHVGRAWWIKVIRECLK